ncbi:MAG: extracellular solute-binding protein [Verrucomicrobiota bacterium]|jgi:raffinose/stachyose/melibiose transport system substrate-binding protein|nr:extracellular solute-binding protein [Verrucomicrobiota bacterium]
MSVPKKLFSFIQTYFALLVVVAVYVWSVFVIITYRAQEAPPEAIVIRLGHWQLEASVREAVDEMAEKYRAMHPNVIIIQDAIPESTYGQWVSTQLMGGTAPDLLQVGAQLPANIWLSYYNRYFQPLSRYVYNPNPYNAGTELADTPLRQTYKDGMKTAYVPEMQEYLSIPLTLFGTRILYNKTLLKEITGLEEAPLNYRDFLAVCAQIASTTNPVDGTPYIPIAGSAYHFGFWDSMMFAPVTYGALRRADFNRDGFVGNDETFVAFKTGLLDFHYPPVAGWLKMIREVTDHFQTGYTGLGRDEAVFLFAQQRAVFMTTGTWDAGSLLAQAEGQFEVGIMDFPLPANDDPYYGGVVEGRIYETPGVGFQFAITRASKHFDVALDFLMFLSSQKGNEELNGIIGWIPAIKGTEIIPLLQAFEPHLEGVYNNVNFALGGNTTIKWGQEFDLYKVNQLSFEDLAGRFTRYYLENGLKDFLEQQRDWRRGMQRNEQYLAGIRGRAILADLAMEQAGTPEERAAAELDSESSWVRYRAITSARQIWGELNHARQMDLVNQTELPEDFVGPYEYSERVMEKIRRRLREQKAAETRLAKEPPDDPPPAESP